MNAKKPREKLPKIRPAIWLYTGATLLLCIGLLCLRPSRPPLEALPSPELAGLHSNVPRTIPELNIARRSSAADLRIQRSIEELHSQILKQISEDRRTWIDGEYF